MAEIGLIASIVGVAGIGVQVAKKLYSISDRTANANQNVKRIAINVSLFTATLKHFASVMQESEHLQRPEIQDVAQQINDECLNVFNDLGKRIIMVGGNDMHSPEMGMKSKRRFSFNEDVVNRVKRAFRQDRVDWLIAQLEYLKSSAMLLCQTMSLALATRRAKELDELVREMKQQFSQVMQVKEDQRVNSQKRLREQEERVEQERIHVEVLIVTRQLNINLLQQFNFSDYNFPRQSDDVDVAQISASDSESSAENTSQKLIEGPPSPMTLVSLAPRHGSLGFLDRQTVQHATGQTVPMTGYDEFVDQLLGRWTILQDMESSSNRRHQVELEKERERTDAKVVDESGTPRAEPGIRTPPRLKVDKTAEVQGESPSTASSPISPPPQYQATSGSEISSVSSVDPKHIAGSGVAPTKGPPKGPAPTSAGSKLTLPPNQAQLIRAKSASAAVSATQSELSPATSFEVRGVRPTPPPFRQRTSDGSVPHQLLTIPRSIIDAPGTKQQPLALEYRPKDASRPEKRVYNPRYQAHVSDDESEPQTPYTPAEETDEERETFGLGIPWRLRSGEREWSYLDSKLIGPRTPFIPEEPDQRTLRNAHTWLDEEWVSERAIREKDYPYQEMVPIGPERSSRQMQRKRWCVLRPLNFGQVNELVERTIQIHKRGSTDLKSPTAVGGIADQARPQIRQQTSQQGVRFAVPSQGTPTIGVRSPYIQPAIPVPGPPRQPSFDGGPLPRGAYSPMQGPSPYWGPGIVGPPGVYGPSSAPLPGGMPPYQVYPQSPRMAPYDREVERRYDADHEDDRARKKKKKRNERNSKYVKTMGKIAAIATALDALDSL